MKYYNHEGRPVQRRGLHWRMRRVEKAVDKIWAAHGYGEGRMTSGLDGEHGRWSWHYYGCACDFGIDDVPTIEEQEQMFEELKVELADGPYQLVLELSKNHIHAEFDPIAFNMAHE